MDLSENRVPQNLIKFDAESSSSPNKIINWGMLTPFSDIIIIIIPHTLRQFNIAIEHGDLVRGFSQPENGGSFHSYVSLPEGTSSC